MDLVTNETIEIEYKKFANELFRFVDYCIIKMEEVKLIPEGINDSYQEKYKNEVIGKTKKKLIKSKKQFEIHYKKEN